jgi:hypothetical protein
MTVGTFVRAEETTRRNAERRANISTAGRPASQWPALSSPPTGRRPATPCAVVRIHACNTHARREMSPRLLLPRPRTWGEGSMRRLPCQRVAAWGPDISPVPPFRPVDARTGSQILRFVFSGRSLWLVRTICICAVQIPPAVVTPQNSPPPPPTLRCGRRGIDFSLCVGGQRGPAKLVRRNIEEKGTQD